MAWIQKLDWRILKGIQEIFRCRALDFLMPKITLLGNVGIIWIITAVALLFTKKYRRCGILLGCGLLTGLLCGNIILKNLVARPRPFWQDTSVELLIKAPKEYSFPSGHTLSSFIAATVLLKTNKWIAIAAWALAACIAFSRLYLYVHFPTDVLMGMVLGVAIGLLVIFIDKKIKRKPTK